MITECPSCKKVISVNVPGTVMCPKCNSLVFIGDPLKDEENRVIKTARELKLERDVESSKKKIEDENGFFNPFGEMKKVKKAGFFKGTPWDRWHELGFAEAFIKTTKEIATSPEKFFKDMKHAANPGLMPIYGIILAFLTVLFQTFWVLKLFQSYFPDFATFRDTFLKMGDLGASIFADENKLRMIYDQMYPDGGSLFSHLVLTPFMSIVVTAFILHLGSVMLGSKTRLTHFYRMSSFIMVTGLFSIFPVIGNIAGFFWRVFLVHKGGMALNNFNGRKAYVFTGFYVAMQLFFSTVGII
ncbi:YIP1 family protein [bacterium]|nr:YIP1 family protein [bacterium]